MSSNSSLDGRKVMLLVEDFHDALNEHEASPSEALTALTNSVFLVARAIRDDIRDSSGLNQEICVSDLQASLRVIGDVALTLSQTDPELWDQVLTENAASTRRAAAMAGVDVKEFQDAFLADPGTGKYKVN